MTPHTALLLGISGLIAAPAAFAQDGAPVEQGEPNTPHFEPAFPEQTRAPASDSGVMLAAEAVAEGLEHPWGIVVLPDGSMLVTERPGRLRRVSPEGELSEPIDGIPEVHAVDQGGLLDVAIGPDFESDGWIYLSFAKPLDDGMSVTAAIRGKLSEDGTELTEIEEIFEQEPPSPTAMHYGSRFVFDGEGHVFITTGEHSDAAERDQAQDLGTTYGKVIRLNLDGSVPEDNPFVDEEGAIDSIWSYGHRNIQAAAMDADGRLWVIEHGPQGGDELNLVEPGNNYGWPVAVYGEEYSGEPVGEGRAAHEPDFVEPRYYWDPVIAPSGMVFYDGGMFPEWQGNVLVGSLKPGALVRLEVEGDMVTGEERLLTDAGRIRDVAVDAEGAVLVITDEEDGVILRLTPGEG